MFWINFLHFYQPANSEIKNATEKSYERIVRAIEEHPSVKFTVNIIGCLLARLDEDLKRIDLIRRIKRLVLKGKLELVGSASYHAFLPLVDLDIVRIQIEENEQILKKYFGENIKLKGFFFPEMAYCPCVAKLVKELGYEWIILDEISAFGKLNKIDLNQNYIDAESELKVVFRNREISQKYAPEVLLKVKSAKCKVQSLITATDAELYGLHHTDHDAYFEKLLDRLDELEIKTITVSDFIEQRNKLTPQKINLFKSSWESQAEEIQNNEPYLLWYNKENKLQKLLWELADYAQKIYLANSNDKNRWWSHWHLMRGLASCTFWWASRRDMSHVFGPVAWNPDQIELGANELVRAIRDLESSTSLNVKLRAEEMYVNVVKVLWEEHWGKCKMQRSKIKM